MNQIKSIDPRSERGAQYFTLFKVVLYFTTLIATRSLIVSGIILLGTVTLIRRYIANKKNWDQMSIQDNLCLCDSDKSVANVASIYVYEKLSFGGLKEQVAEKMLKRMVRLRQRVVRYMGDHYLEDIGVEKALKCIFNHPDQRLYSDQDLCRFLDPKINKRLEKDSLPWEMHYFEHFGQQESAVVLIAHHSMGDGLSAQFMLLFSSDDGTEIKHYPMRTVGVMQQCLLMALGCLLIPLVMIKTSLAFDRPNPLNTKVTISGMRQNHVSKNYDLQKVKNIAKVHQVTINDFVSSALGVAIKKYFESKHFNHTAHVTLVFPINIRYSQPQSWQEVIIGNYFSCELMQLPIGQDFKQVLPRVHKQMNIIKGSTQFYAMYLLSLITGGLFPYRFVYWLLNRVSSRITFQFSNVPGPILPLIYHGKQSKRAWIFVNPAAQQGVSLTVYSHNGVVKFGATTDLARVKDPEVLVRYFEESMDEMIGEQNEEILKTNSTKSFEFVNNPEQIQHQSFDQ